MTEPLSRELPDDDTIWHREGTVTVTETYRAGFGRAIIEVAEHRGHQNWEATATLRYRTGQNEYEVADRFHAGNKEMALERARDEWGLDVPESEWNLDPSFANVSDRVGPGGRVEQ